MEVLKTSYIVPPPCPNCGEIMQLKVGWSALYQAYYVYWYCIGTASDDACENNGIVLPECGTVDVSPI